MIRQFTPKCQETKNTRNNPKAQPSFILGGVILHCTKDFAQNHCRFSNPGGVTSLWSSLNPQEASHVSNNVSHSNVHKTTVIHLMISPWSLKKQGFLSRNRNNLWILVWKCTNESTDTGLLLQYHSHVNITYLYTWKQSLLNIILNSV